jgi:hypothetical protein
VDATGVTEHASADDFSDRHRRRVREVRRVDRGLEANRPARSRKATMEGKRGARWSGSDGCTPRASCRDVRREGARARGKAGVAVRTAGTTPTPALGPPEAHASASAGVQGHSVSRAARERRGLGQALGAHGASDMPGAGARLAQGAARRPGRAERWRTIAPGTPTGVQDVPDTAAKPAAVSRRARAAAGCCSGHQDNSRGRGRLRVGCSRLARTSRSHSRNRRHTKVWTVVRARNRGELSKRLPSSSGDDAVAMAGPVAAGGDGRPASGGVRSRVGNATKAVTAASSAKASRRQARRRGGGAATSWGRSGGVISCFPSHSDSARRRCRERRTAR